MARGRMLNNSISRSLKFDLLPDDTCRLLATWIISHLDVRGVFYGDPAIVQSLIFTRRRDVTAEQVDEYLQAMENVGLITLFEAEGQQWQQWPGFSANQIGLRTEREKTDWPLPPGYTPPIATESPLDDGEETDTSGQDAASKSAEVESQVQVESQIEPKDLAPAAANPKPKRAKKPKTPVSSAVQVFRQNTHRYPAKSWYDDITETVGNDSANLAVWGKVVKAWVGLGWKPTNVKGMLDFYERGEVPPGPKQGGPSGSPRTPSQLIGKPPADEIPMETILMQREALARHREWKRRKDAGEDVGPAPGSLSEEE